MSVASVEKPIDELPVERADRDDDTDWLDRRASLRRPFTQYQPRHRADGPAV